jgi:hypothetical protein
MAGPPGLDSHRGNIPITSLIEGRDTAETIKLLNDKLGEIESEKVRIMNYMKGKSIGTPLYKPDGQSS